MGWFCVGVGLSTCVDTLRVLCVVLVWLVIGFWGDGDCGVVRGGIFYRVRIFFCRGGSCFCLVVLCSGGFSCWCSGLVVLFFRRPLGSGVLVLDLDQVLLLGSGEFIGARGYSGDVGCG